MAHKILHGKSYKTVIQKCTHLGNFPEPMCLAAWPILSGTFLILKIILLCYEISCLPNDKKYSEICKQANEYLRSL